MSIIDDIDNIAAQLNTVIPKEEGTLIRSTDWNNLVNRILDMGEAIKTQQGGIETNTTTIGTLQSSVTDIENRVTAIENLIGSDGDSDTIIARINDLEQNKLDKTEFNTFKSKLDPLLLQYSVLLETDNLDYQLGESAIITATIKQLNGDAVNSRPWLDVVASWGRVSAVQGYEVLTGSGGRALAVRCDNNGIAKFKIKAENAPETSDVQEAQIGSFFATRAQHQSQELEMWQLLDGSNNSSDPMAETFLTEMSLTYKGGNNSGVNDFVDGYFDYARKGQYYWYPPIGGSWNNLRSTIAVFAKDDALSNTPDAGKGVSSIQIHFKDWVGPWIEYFDNEDEDYKFEIDIPDLVVKEDPIGFDPLKDIEIYFDDRLSGAGSIGRGKFLGKLGQFTQHYDTESLPAGAKDLILTMGEAAAMQMGFDVNQVKKGGNIDVIKSTMRSGTRSQTANQLAGDIDGKVANIDQGLDSVNKKHQELVTTMDGQITGLQSSLNSKIGSVESDVSVLNNKVNETSVIGSNIQQMLGSIDNKVTGINVLDTDSVQGSIAKITADIGLIKTNISAIER